METNKKVMYEIPSLEELYVGPAVVMGFSKGLNENLTYGNSTEQIEGGDPGL